jgi:hypothetical protein
MGVPASEVGYTTAITGRGDHEVHKEHVVALGREKKIIASHFIRDFPFPLIGSHGSFYMLSFYLKGERNFGTRHLLDLIAFKRRHKLNCRKLSIMRCITANETIFVFLKIEFEPTLDVHKITLPFLN